ncbi:MAG: vWA domain-containing protein, partial [Candidatus Kapaibacteriota bacterium]
MQKEVWDIPDSTISTVYLSGTKPVDSVEPNALRYDIWRVDIDHYPDTVKLFARVFDSEGNFVSQMAEPYKKTSHEYFSFLEEFLGKVYNLRNVPIAEFKVREFGKGDSIPYAIVLTVDYSGSMSGVTNAILEGAELFMSLKYPNDKIAFCTFTKDFEVKIPFESNLNKLLDEFYK